MQFENRGRGLLREVFKSEMECFVGQKTTVKLFKGHTKRCKIGFLSYNRTELEHLI